MATNPNGPNRSRKWIFIGAALAGVGIIVVALLFLLPGPPPEEVARRWAADNVDAAGEALSGFVLRAFGQEGGIQGKILTELGGEWIEDRINEHLLWTFSAATPDGAGNHIVIATASVDFEVIQPPINRRVQASLPFELRIRGSEVLENRPVLAAASFDAQLAGIEGRLTPSGLGVDVEKVGETADKVSDTVNELLGR